MYNWSALTSCISNLRCSDRAKEDWKGKYMVTMLGTSPPSLKYTPADPRGGRQVIEGQMRAATNHKYKQNKQKQNKNNNENETPRGARELRSYYWIASLNSLHTHTVSLLPGNVSILVSIVANRP